MILMLAALMLAQAPPEVSAPPSPEAEALGAALARSGPMLTLARLVEIREVPRLLGDHPDLTETERNRLAAIAFHAADVEIERKMISIGDFYARLLSVEELRMLAAAQDTPAAKHLREIMPGVVALTGGLDIKTPVVAALCQANTRMCPAK